MALILKPRLVNNLKPRFVFLNLLFSLAFLIGLTSCSEEENNQSQEPSELQLRWRQDLSNGARVPIHNAMYYGLGVAYQKGTSTKPQKWVIMDAQTGQVSSELESADEDRNFPNAAPLHTEQFLIEHGESSAQCYSISSQSLIWEETFTGELVFANLSEGNYVALIRDGQDLNLLKRPLLGGAIDTVYRWLSSMGNVVDFKLLADTLYFIQEDAQANDYFLKKVDLNGDSLLWSTGNLGYLPLETWAYQGRLQLISNKVLVRTYQSIEVHQRNKGSFLWDRVYTEDLGMGSFLYPYQDRLYVASSQEGLDCLDLNSGGALSPSTNIGQRNLPVKAGRLADDLFFTSYKDGVYQLNRLSLPTGDLQSYPATDYPYLYGSSVAVDPNNARLFLYNLEEAFALDFSPN